MSPASDGIRNGAGKTALVIGGTGPTGPDVVRGLVERGYETSIFHSGMHEVPLSGSVRHIHGDPHFPETIMSALGDAEFNVVVAQYGRLRHLTEHLRGRTGHVVAIGGAMTPLAARSDPRWGPLGRPAVVREQNRHLISDPSQGKLGFRIAEAADEFLAVGEAAGFAATYIAYPTLYGPRQPGSPEWAIVRRLRDKRPTIILADGGLRLETRAYVRNVGLAPLLAVDRPDLSAGRSYVVTDRDLYTVRQRVEFIARHLGVNVEIVDMPYRLATPAHPLYRIGSDHRAASGDEIRSELDYYDTIDAATALGDTVDWLLQAPPDQLEEIETQLGDPFDYAFEDHLSEWWRSVMDSAPQPGSSYTYSHVYRHPTHPDESWRRV